jgi:type I restriction enzyme S subunit
MKTLPEKWEIKPFSECIEKTVTSNRFKIPQSKFLDKGKYAIIDQSVEFIAGYTDDSSKIYEDDLPVVIFGDHTRIFKFIDFPFALGADGTRILVPKNDILNPKYFYFFLRGLRLENHGYSRHYKFLKENQIIVPPLTTQKKITIILEKAERLKEWRKEAGRLTDEFLKSTFLEMFGDPVKNPKRWEIKRIQDVILSIEAGWSANGELRAQKTNEYAVLKISAVTSGTFLPNEHKVINNLSELKKIVYPEKGDVIFSRANTRELVGATCLIMHDYPFLLLPDKLWKIKVDKKKICSEYLKFILSHPAIRGQISNKSTGTSGSMFNISMSKLKSIKIVIPPLELQVEFASIVYQVEHMREHQSQSKQQIDNLFNVLMQKAFKGELAC